MVQTALAAGLSGSSPCISSGTAPLFAPVAATICIDMTLGQRLRRAIALIVGAGVGALLISAIGTGPWQIAVVVAAATSVAVFVDGRAEINVQAGLSAILVAASYVPGKTRSE